MLIFRQLFPAVYAIGVAVIAVFIALAVLQFQQIRFELEREKISILANRTAAPFEAAAGIGLPLSSVRNADALLERARQIDPAIEAIVVTDDAGRALFTSGAPGSVPLGMAEQGGALPVDGTSWSGETADRFYAGEVIVDPSGMKAGDVVIVYSGRESRTETWSMIGQLIIAGVVFALAMAPVVWAALRVMLPRSAREYDAIEAGIFRFEAESWRAEAPASDRQPDTGASAGLRPLLSRAEARYREAAAGVPERMPDRWSESPEAARVEVQGLRGRVVTVTTCVLAAVTLLFSALTLNAFDRAIAPTLEGRTELIGALVRSEMQRTLELGIPISALGGLTPYLEAGLRDFPEIARITILDKSGAMIAAAERAEAPEPALRSRLGEFVGISASRTELSVLAGNDFVGTIRIEGSPSFIETRLRDVLLDVSVLAMAMLLIGVELALAAVAVSIWTPHARVLTVIREQMEGRFGHVIPETGPFAWRRLAARLNDHALDLSAKRQRKGQASSRGAPAILRLSDPGDIRLPLFLFALGTEVTASFLPIIASAASRPDWLSSEFAGAAPLILYLVAVAAFSPLAGTLGQRFGAFRLFTLSVPPVVGALIWMAVSGDVVQITLARGLVAVFFALATVSAQDYALSADGAGKTVKVASAFIGLVLAGTFCGNVIGGVIASRLGFPAAILTGGLFVAGSGIAAYFLMRGPAGDPAPATDRPAELPAVPVRPLPFAGLLAGIAIPASAVTAAIIWYFTPIVLSAEGLRTSDIARVVMVYYLAAILIGPLAARLATDQGRTTALIVAGATLSGLALLFLSTVLSIPGLFLAIVTVGIGHALIRSPIFALASQFAGSSRRPILALRVFERVGAVIGLAAAASIKGLGVASTIPLLFGSVVLVGVAVFALATGIAPRKPPVPEKG